MEDDIGDMKIHHSVAVHVGQFIDEVHIQEGHLSEFDLCEHMGWGMKEFDDFLVNKIIITAEIAEKLSEILLGSAKFYIGMQKNYDAAQARKEAENGN